LNKGAILPPLLLVTVLLLIAQGTSSVAATDASTRISNFTATESGGVVAISGTLQYRNLSGDFQPLNSSKVVFYWNASGSALTNYIGEVYSNDKTSGDPGSFVYTWLHGLEPGEYYVKGVYGGDSWGGYTFKACEENTAVLIRLRIKVAIDNPTVSIAQGDSLTVTVSVEAINSNLANPVTLSVKYPSQVFASETFSPASHTTPFVSKLTLKVLNVTAPGTYVVVIVATSDSDSSVSASAPLVLNVQQNTHTISVEIEGLPSDIETSIFIDGTMVENVGTGTTTLIISNRTKTISVSNQVLSGDTLYLCQDYKAAADVIGADSFNFTYATEYRLKITGNLPPTIVSKLVLIVNGTDKSIDPFKPARGYNDFLPKDSDVHFAITPPYITTKDDVNYKFSGWRDLTSGETIKPFNATSNDLYDIKLSRPYVLEGDYDKWAIVTLRVNLPSDMSTKPQVGLVGSQKQNVTVVGSVAYQAGEYLVGATFEISIGQDQLVLYNHDGNTRYEFQGLNPPSPITLVKHITINITYTAKYRVQLISQFPDAVLQPAGGIGWHGIGEVAMLQVKKDATDKNGIPYVFNGLTGGVITNQTTASFPVTGPVDIEVMWKINWVYVLTMGGAVVGVAAPGALVIKKKVLPKVTGLRKKAVLKKHQAKTGPSEQDMKVYTYIVSAGGSIRLSDGVNELGMSHEEIEESIQRLEEMDYLRRRSEPG
jgi:hypothetical protein